jgi:glycosyltransferase involved in cell wall biosynthesis
VTPAVVSIMMPAYNAENYIGYAIDSVLAQTYPYWELVIVNDGSTDSTPEILASYTDPRIRVFHQVNGGEAAARNTALEHLQGELVAFLDADDLYLPNHLEATTNFLLAHPQLGGVYTDGYHCDQNGDKLQSLSSRRRGPFEGDIFEEVVRASDVFGPPLCVILRSEVIFKHSLGFDTAIIIGPDWDFLTRYSEVAQFGYIDQPTCLYRIHLSNISFRVNSPVRSQSLAKCRINAIKLGHFNNCSVDTRIFVFYDLLINLLTEHPDMQFEITQLPEFTDLPAKEQGRLFRLMASKALQSRGDHTYIQKWLQRSHQLNPADRTATILAALYNLSPLFCKKLLQIKASIQPKASTLSPVDILK